MLSISHINVQKYIEENCKFGSKNPFEKSFILEVHKMFYTQDGMDSFLKIEDGDSIEIMIPGIQRHRDVAVGDHIAPKFDEVNHLFNLYESQYKQAFIEPQWKKLIYALSSHHRLSYIHPFLDGNGRVSRLMLDGALNFYNIEGYGLWNISRGLAKNHNEYNKYLRHADTPRMSDTDGRGSLSSKCLEEYLFYMMNTALEQINYMNSCLKLDTLGNRIRVYSNKVNSKMFDITPLPDKSELIFNELLICGEIKRGDIGGIIGKGRTTAVKVVNELLKRDFLYSKDSKDTLKLKINAHFGSQILPNLIPQQ